MPRAQQASFLPPILWAGSTCGRTDITAALVVYGHFGLLPLPLLQGIAGGILGSRTCPGGLATGALGLFCHFFIAVSAAAVSYAVAFLVERAGITGPLNGAALYYFMQLVVLPLSVARRFPFSVKLMLFGGVIHIFCVGLPIALAVRRFSAR